MKKFLNYKQLQAKADAMKNAKHNFYTYVLAYSMQYLEDKDGRYKHVTEEEFQELLAIMEDYLEDCFHVSAWDCGDALANCISEHGARDVIDNYNCEGKYADRDYDEDSFLVEELCNM